MGEEQNRALTIEEEKIFLEEEAVHKFNFRPGLTDYDKKELHIPMYLWKASKNDVLPEHVNFMRDYVQLWTVGENRQSAPHGLVFYGDQGIGLSYMVILLDRIYRRKRTVYCESVFNLERECRDWERIEDLSERISVLGVHGFPFFMNGLPEGRDDLTATPFHQMIYNRRNNGLPTLFVCNTTISELEKRYKFLPSHIQSALKDFNKFIEIKKAP